MNNKEKKRKYFADSGDLANYARRKFKKLLNGTNQQVRINYKFYKIFSK